MVAVFGEKTAHTKSADLVNIVTKAPMELVCIDYLSLERTKGGYENILVITDYFIRYAQAISTHNQTAATIARVIFDNFFVHYGFLGKLHSDQGANFLSKMIKKLCNLTGTVKTRTIPYHPMGNGMCERFNKTLLNMLGTLQEKQKSDWKSYFPALTHAYNAATHKSTGYAPFYLMYGRHPQLAVRGGRVVRRCWVNFQCRGVLRTWITVGQGPIVLALGAGGGCLDIFFSHLSLLFSFSLSLGDGPI